jgi:hypothetical protein
MLRIHISAWIIVKPFQLMDNWDNFNITNYQITISIHMKKKRLCASVDGAKYSTFMLCP